MTVRYLALGLFLMAGCAVEPAGSGTQSTTVTETPFTATATASAEPTAQATQSAAPQTDTPAATAAPSPSAVATPSPGAPTIEETAAASPSETPDPSTPVAVVGEHQGPVDLFGPPDSGLGPRPRRRMDIEQLNASLRRATGGIGWTEMQSNGEELDLLVSLSETLGIPDYIQTTVEDLEPSLLFQKFLGDGARSVCHTLMEREFTGDSQVFLVHASASDTWPENADAIKANLRHLLLRFHSQNYAPGDAQLEKWHWLFQSVQHVSPESGSREAWNATCVALLSHPDFYTY